LNVPRVFDEFAVNEPPAVIAEPEAVRAVMVSPSGSEALTGNVTSVPGNPVLVAGAETMGARSTYTASVTVIEVEAEPVRVFVAVKVTL
jgi:hypothetical protein